MSRVPPARLRRRKAVLSTRPLVHVFCEGKNTEPSYIRDFAKDCGVKVYIHDVIGTPVTLVDAASDLRRKSGRKGNDSFEKNDPVWVVFDRDEHPNIEQAFNKAKGNGVEIAFSNPCVEVWALLHFQDHDRPLHRHEMQKALEVVMPSFKAKKSKRFDFVLMRPRYQDAHRRACQMEVRRLNQGDEFGNPYTRIHRLMELIKNGGRK